MSDQQSSSTTPQQVPREGRTLILCFDGTANRFKEDRNTNVVLLFSMLERNQPDKQLVYYQTGIGTYTPSGLISRTGQWFARMLDEAFGLFLEDHVLGGYKFLMDTYQKGDKICLFGFSRGAYTARALAAMIHKVGLLPPRNVEQVPFAYKIYKESGDEYNHREPGKYDPAGYYSDNFTRTFSRKVQVEFLGIWDTVSSVGFFPRYLPHTSTNHSVKNVRHALALDERRAKFKATYWNRSPKEKTNGEEAGEARDTGKTDGQRKSSKDDLPPFIQTVEEVWFAGGHGDIGGGWEAYRTQDQLARIPFRWMVRQAKKCVPGILWDTEALKDHDVLRPAVGDADASKKYLERETQDATADFHSAFIYGKVWYLWIFLELIPLVGMVKWLGYNFRFLRLPNLWTPRHVRPDEPVINVHSSVWTRLHYDPNGYEISVEMDPSKTVFVDGWALRTTDKLGRPLPSPPKPYSIDYGETEL